jgi:hypothetical protein
MTAKSNKTAAKRERDDMTDKVPFPSPKKSHRHWTDEDAKLIKKMREEDKLTWPLYPVDTQLTEGKLLPIFPVAQMLKSVPYTTID